MKITCLLGSPRPNGNSATIAKTFLNSAKELGADISTFELNKLNYHGCQECMGCKIKSDKCIQSDDLTEVLEDISNTDVLVIASGVFGGDITASLKGFIERSSSYLNVQQQSRLKPGKKLVFILSQSTPDEKIHADIFPKYNNYFSMLGINSGQFIRACGVGPGDDIRTHNDIMNMAKETAKNIMVQA